MKTKPDMANPVSRSTYQKLSEENKRLLKDIFTLTMDGLSFEAIEVRGKWRKKFREEAEFNQLLKEVCTQYLKDHPEYDIGNWKKEDNGKV